MSPLNKCWRSRRPSTTSTAISEERSIPRVLTPSCRTQGRHQLTRYRSQGPGRLPDDCRAGQGRQRSNRVRGVLLYDDHPSLRQLIPWGGAQGLHHFRRPEDWYSYVHSGFIALKELRKVSKDLGELADDTILQEMIDRADTDGDGVIS